MELADQMIIRHRLMDAIRLLEVHRVEYIPDGSVEFDYRGFKVNLKFTVKDNETEVPKMQKIGT